MFKLAQHELKQLDYHVVDERGDRLRLVDKANGHFQVILTDVTVNEFFSNSSEYLLEWLPNLSKERYRAKTLYDDKGNLKVGKRDKPSDEVVEGEYYNVLKIMVSPLPRYSKSQLKLLPNVVLKRQKTNNSFFSLSDQYTLATATMPSNSKRNSDKTIMSWVTYYVTPAAAQDRTFLRYGLLKTA